MRETFSAPVYGALSALFACFFVVPMEALEMRVDQSYDAHGGDRA